MRILVLAVHFEVTGARYITDAFKRLGHDVRHSGPQARLKDAWGVDVPEKYIWQEDAYYNFTYDWTPDLIVIADTLTLPETIPAQWRTVPTVIWSNDNHVRNSRLLQGNKQVSHYFLAHAHGQAQPVTHDDETWLPCATDAVAFPPHNRLSREVWDSLEYDICCVGVMYPRRARLVQMLRDAGLKVFAATGLVYDEYREAYSKSRMSLCVSANGDVAQRVFETAGIGCLILTDLLTDLVDDDTNKALGLSGFAVYQNDDECIARALEFIHDKDARNQGRTGAHTLQQIVLNNHTWDVRAQVVIDWYNKEYGVASVEITSDKVTILDKPIKAEDVRILGVEVGESVTISPPTKRPYLNLGCGKTHLPSTKPAGHEAVDDAIYKYPLWVNVDKVQGVGADKTFDLFTYPWPLEDNSFDGALLAHIVEHIPHEIKVSQLIKTENGTKDIRGLELSNLQDGWYAFWSELYRVLTPGALVHIVSPYGWSDGGITDPSHTRYLTINTFTHSMTPDISDGSTFQYNNGGINFRINGVPLYRFSPYFQQVYDKLKDSNDEQEVPPDVLIGVYLNMVYDFYIKLECVK